VIPAPLKARLAGSTRGYTVPPSVHLGGDYVNMGVALASTRASGAGPGQLALLV
jgi:hypothetical protein